MRKIITTMVFASSLLVGCASQEGTTVANDTDQSEFVELENQLATANERIAELEEQLVEDVAVEAEEEVEEVETMEVGEDQPLENVGQFKNTRAGRIELLNIVRPADTYTLADSVDINFNDIKIMHHSEIPESEKENHKSYYGFDDEGYSIQLSYLVTNNTDQTIGGIEIEDLVTADGKQYNLYHNAFTNSGSSYEVRPNATANVSITFAVSDPDTNSLNLYFQPYDADGYHLEETSVNLEF